MLESALGIFKRCARLRCAHRAAGPMAAMAFLLPVQAFALTPIESADLSPDISVTLDGSVFNNEDVAIDDLPGDSVTMADLGALPNATAINAYQLLGNGDQLFSFDTTVDLVGGVTAAPGDVIRYNGFAYSIEFAAVAEGVPDGVRTDAVSISGGDLVLSFDLTVSLAGNTYDDEDLVAFDGAAFSLFFDGSAEGLDTSLDLDGAHVFASNGNLGLSFDGSGTIGGVDFDDEDVLEFDANGPSWEMAWNGSAERPGWASADVNAVHFVPEPSLTLQLTVGGALLGALRRRSRTRG